MSESGQLDTLRWQFRLTWQLASYHLSALTDPACLWEPASGSWTVRQAADGRWRSDWIMPEPDPAPTTSIGWLTWHLIWWWSSLLTAVRDETPTPRDEVFWPGSADAVRLRLETLSREWADVLDSLADADLERPVAYPWREERPLRLAIAWANSELMKNVAEIGYANHLFLASRQTTRETR